MDDRDEIRRLLREAARWVEAGCPRVIRGGQARVCRLDAAGRPAGEWVTIQAFEATLTVEGWPR